jgi:hypothetical protein
MPQREFVDAQGFLDDEKVWDKWGRVFLSTYMFMLLLGQWKCPLSIKDCFGGLKT